MAADGRRAVTPERWARLKALFGEALAHAGEERAAFLRRTAAAEPDLGAELAALVEAEERGAGFDGVTDPGEPAGDAPPVPERIGPWRIVRELGHGGMGTVYLAARDDGEFRQVVALKVIRTGADPRLAVARFRRERAILAGLAHPGIATLLDGGTTEQGLPYYTMEYVEGEPIDRYCQARGLSVEARLELVLSVCAAVQHAHGRLVVHRDLKPGNILVAPDGAPKLLDFGLAKLLDPEEGAETTAAPLRFATPAFASPEHLRGGPVTTAGDVYSLGALLYVLLTGRRPFRAASGSYGELVRAVCEQEPAPPSAAVAAEPPGALAAGPPGQVRRLAGDLDAIVLKALRKEPERRYGSVEQLADDLRNYLEGRPVRARAGNAAYRAGKFLRRHRAGLLAACLVVAAAAAAFAETSRQRAIAQRRLEDVRRLAGSLLFEFHDAIASLPGATRARELVVRRAQTYLDQLSREAGGDLAVQEDLAAAWERLGEVQGTFPSGLGDVPGATASLRAAVAIREAAARRRPGDPEAALRLGLAQSRLGFLEANAGDRAGVDRARRGAELADWAQAQAQAPASPAVRTRVAQAFGLLARAQHLADDLAPAAPAYAREAAGGERVIAEAPGDRPARLALASASYFLGCARMAAEPAEGERLLRRSLELGEALAREEPGDTQAAAALAFGHVGMARALVRAGRADEALAEHLAALRLRERIAAADPADAGAQQAVAASQVMVGRHVASRGSPGEARASFLAAVRILEELERTGAGNAHVRVVLGMAHGDLGRLEVRLARAARGPSAAASWRAAAAWLLRSEEEYAGLRREGRLPEEQAGFSAENRELLGACEAALAPDPPSPAR
jgi:non-specific serine/threonine protein kinase/serine/threonine-protein kinase